jgi:hypothetical protein
VKGIGLTLRTTMTITTTNIMVDVLDYTNDIVVNGTDTTALRRRWFYKLMKRSWEMISNNERLN